MEKKTLDEVAAVAGGRVAGDGSLLISDVSAFDDAGPGEITLAASKSLLKRASECRASALIVDESAAPVEGKSLIRAAEPRLAFARVIDLFRPAPVFARGVHPAAFVSPGAVIGKDVTIRPFAVVEEGAVIGDGTVIYSGVYIDRNVTVGSEALLYANVSVLDGTIIGSRVTIHANTVIGSDGFGYVSDEGGHHKIPQRGIVRVGDDVEIGASVTIDRATVGETVIGRGSKIDNLVQIAHNVTVGPGSIMAAQVGIAGSTKVGRGVVIGGQSGVVGHISVGDGAMVGGGSGVFSEVSPGEVVSGFPAMDHRKWLRTQQIYKKLPELRKRVGDLEARLKLLEESAEDRSQASNPAQER